MHQPEPSGEPARPAARRPELCEPGTTKCQARTRLYRGGELVAQGFPVADISDHLEGDESAVIWLDLRNPDRDDLSVLGEEFGLHPLHRGRPLRRGPVAG
jgi:magnesium transporter